MKRENIENNQWIIKAPMIDSTLYKNTKTNK